MSDNIPFEIQMEIIKKVSDVKSLVQFRNSDGSINELIRDAALASTNLIPRGLANRVVSRDVVSSFRQGLANDMVIVSVTEAIPQTGSENVMTNGFGGPDISNDVFEAVLEEADTDVAMNGVVGLVSSGMLFSRGVTSNEGSSSGGDSRFVSGLRLGSVSSLGINGDVHSTIVNEVRVSEAPMSSVSVALSLGKPSGVGGSSQLPFGSNGMENGTRSVAAPVMVGGSRSGSAGVQRVSSLAELAVTNGFSGSNLGGLGSGDVSRDNGIIVSVGLSLSMSNGPVVSAEGGGVHVTNGVMGNGIAGGNQRGAGPNNVAGDLDLEYILSWFNQDVNNDRNRLRMYRTIGCVLKEIVRRRCERIRRLRLFRDTPDAADIIRFWERVQLEETARGANALLSVMETEVKICEKAAFILRLRRCGAQ